MHTGTQAHFPSITLDSHKELIDLTHDKSVAQSGSKMLISYKPLL